MSLALLAALAVVAAPAAPRAPAPTAPARPAQAAAAASRSAPVNVDAAEVHYAPRRREVIFTGAPVTLTREDARLTCARLVAKNDERGEIVSATCSGDVRFTTEARVVTCDSATYENAEARLTCAGNALLREGKAEAHGERLVYEFRTDEVRLLGGSGRVTVTLPGDEIEQRRREQEERRRARAKPEARP